MNTRHLKMLLEISGILLKMLSLGERVEFEYRAIANIGLLHFRASNALYQHFHVPHKLEIHKINTHSSIKVTGHCL